MNPNGRSKYKFSLFSVGITGRLVSEYCIISLDLPIVSNIGN
jgi:hypothetical protein